MLNMNEIDFLVDLQCKSFWGKQAERFEIIDDSNCFENSIDEGSTMLFFQSKTSAVLSYNRLVSLPETRLLWDLSQEEFVIVITNDWLEKARNQDVEKIPTYKANNE
tara:strand:+ start:179 stop:499 length:321 start_codon:yes stop_codon:yes gene_type:complete